MAPALAFHKVDDAFEWGVTRINPKRFRSLILFLKEAGYQGMSVEQYFDIDHPLPNKPVILTFDDGYQKLYEHAIPVLREVDFSATLFVITDYIGKMNTWDVNLGGFKFSHLNWSEIREIQSMGFEIGSHTVSHPHLTWLKETDIRFELEASRKSLEDGLGSEVETVSFPFGRYNETVLEMAKLAGYEHACAFFKKKKNLRKYKESFVLERKAHYIFDTYRSLNAKLNPESVSGKLETAKLKLINLGSYGTSLVKILKR